MLLQFKVNENDKYPHTKEMSENTNMEFITRQGLEEIQNKIKETLEKKPEITERIQAARQQGGLEENEELLVALEDMQRADIELSRFQDIIDGCSIVEDMPSGDYEKVQFGTTVKLRNLGTNKIMKYAILGEVESDPTKGSISYKSPLGRELIGHKKGDFVMLERGNTEIEYKILGIFVP